MIKKIIVSKYIKNGLTIEDAENIAVVLKNELSQLNSNDILQFDFSNVKFFTTLFFNTVFISLLRKMSLDEYKKTIQLINLSEVGQTAYDYSLENAKRFIAISKDEQLEREKIINDILKEI